jgi:hypothetical protein
VKLSLSPLCREFLIFLGFAVLTALMTWPWVLHLRNAVPDTGDPYAISYFMWWDFHQTFHAPRHLFEATILYPYHHTLAFGEFDYGVSLLFFPLFALGFPPVTVFSIAAFLSFPFTGYGTFRLARTLSGSVAIAWVAGIILAFLPFRFHHLSHLHLIFAGWIVLLFEALVRFVRQRSWSRAAWLGFAFLMNGLTCTTWLLLTIIPLGISAALFLTRNNAWLDPKFWVRSGGALCLASLLLLPFLLPSRRAAVEHGFTRTPEEVGQYSAHWINWLAAEDRNKVWHGLGAAGNTTEMVLFPGLLAPLLALTALLLPEIRSRVGSGESNLLEKAEEPARSELVGHALIWIVLGFAGSFGINFFFHKFLYDYISVFRAMRVAARWAMICYVGLALLAGLGAYRLAAVIAARWLRFGKPVTVSIVVLAILFELHAAPLKMVRGEIHPDALTLDLRSRKMSGGIVELPMGDATDHLYMLRAADHLHPLVNGKYSFVPPLQIEIQQLTMARPIPDRLLDIFEGIPVSYVTVHHASLSPQDEEAMQSFLDRGVTAGRFRFIKSFDGVSNGLRQHNELYAVTKTEPNVRD